MMELQLAGHARIPSNLPEEMMSELKESVFPSGSAGKRCLLDRCSVAETARLIRETLLGFNILAPTALAVQAIAFDKSPTANWKVPWHQDLMFPFAGRVTTPGYSLPTVKDGVHFAQPPVNVLEALLAVRLHLDDCDSTNGPLRVSPGTHRFGIQPSSEASDLVKEHGQVELHAKTGDLILMKPLLLHASSQAVSPNHRRVLHFVFYSGEPTREPWAQAL